MMNDFFFCYDCNLLSSGFLFFCEGVDGTSGFRVIAFLGDRKMKMFSLGSFHFRRKLNNKFFIFQEHKTIFLFTATGFLLMC